jgi:hypothetical protein
LLIEDKITEFEKSLKSHHQQLNQRHKFTKLTNLNPLQAKTLKELKSNKNIIIKPTDKNVGPSMMLKEHLLTPDYRQLSHLEATRAFEKLKLHSKTLFRPTHNPCLNQN